MPTREEWAKALLIKKSWPVNPANVLVIVAVASGENSDATWNPLDTEYYLPPCTDYNKNGVKNYESAVQGLDATISTLGLPYYSRLGALMKNPDATAEEKAKAWDQSPWVGGSTNYEAIMVTQVAANPDPYYNHPVAGTGDWPFNTDGTPIQNPTPTPEPAKPTDPTWPGAKQEPAAAALPNACDAVLTPSALSGKAMGTWVLTGTGHVYQRGAAPFYGSYVHLDEATKRIERLFVSIERAGDKDEDGYHIISAEGEVFTFDEKWWKTYQGAQKAIQAIAIEPSPTAPVGTPSPTTVPTSNPALKTAEAPLTVVTSGDGVTVLQHNDPPVVESVPQFPAFALQQFTPVSEPETPAESATDETKEATADTETAPDTEN